MLRVAKDVLDGARVGNNVVETHVSSLVFVRERAHKCKKPVKFAFVDQSTAEWGRNLREMASFVPNVFDADVLARTGQLAQRYIDGRGPLFAERLDRNLVVDGHDDLLADDIFCLDDGPRILDCLEFDDRLRWGDVLLDVGFLAMDLEHLGRPDLADDLVGGLPGTGKSTVAAALGDRLGWSVLRSDETRKALAGLGPGAHRPAAYGEGLYTEEYTEMTYRALFTDAERRLGRGESVVVDASFSNARWRTDASALAQRASADLTELRCLLPTAMGMARMARSVPARRALRGGRGARCPQPRGRCAAEQRADVRIAAITRPGVGAARRLDDAARDHRHGWMGSQLAERGNRAACPDRGNRQ